MQNTYPSSISKWSRESFTTALGELLIAEGHLDNTSLERARRVATENRSLFVEALTQLGLIGDRTLAELTAKLLGLAIVGAADFPASPVLPDRFKPKYLRRVKVLPISIDEHTLSVAMADPLDDEIISAFAVAAGKNINILIGLPIDLEAAFERLYRDQENPGDDKSTEINDLVDETSDDAAERLKDLASEEPIIRLVNQIISRAVETRASDIHIEPFEDRLRLRYRYDGILQEVDSPHRRQQAAIISRIKIMAALDIAERRLPQDGRIKLVVRGNEIDLRVSTIPSLHGERVVLRILDRSAVNLNFDTLGVTPALQEQLRRLLELPNGILLVTGPTGSGKTTSLYTGLLHLNSVGRNIMTVEDPVEYQLPGVTQIQTKSQIGLDFATLLRAILRQDPDIVMIGEIRDLETAQIAVQAALTGHLVLSTLHTNSAAATIARLRDMGLEDYLLTATLNGILAQRLIRRLCPACKRPVDPTPDLAQRFELSRFADHGSILLHEPEGCEKCRNTGYLGRIAVAELLEPNDEIQHLILTKADPSAIQNAACASGMQTMYESGMRQVVAGLTSLSEVLRSLRLDG